MSNKEKGSLASTFNEHPSDVSHKGLQWSRMEGKLSLASKVGGSYLAWIIGLGGVACIGVGLSLLLNGETKTQNQPQDTSIKSHIADQKPGLDLERFPLQSPGASDMANFSIDPEDGFQNALTVRGDYPNGISKSSYDIKGKTIVSGNGVRTFDSGGARRSLIADQAGARTTTSYASSRLEDLQQLSVDAQPGEAGDSSRVPPATYNSERGTRDPLTKISPLATLVSSGVRWNDMKRTPVGLRASLTPEVKPGLRGVFGLRIGFNVATEAVGSGNLDAEIRKLYEVEVIPGLDLSANYSLKFADGWQLHLGLGYQRLDQRVSYQSEEKQTNLYRPNTQDTIYRNPLANHDRIVTTDSVAGTVSRDFQHTNKANFLSLRAAIERSWEVGKRKNGDLGIMVGTRYLVAYDLKGKLPLTDNGTAELDRLPEFGFSDRIGVLIGLEYRRRISASLDWTIRGESQFAFKQGFSTAAWSVGLRWRR